MRKLPVTDQLRLLSTKHRCSEPASYETLATRSFDRMRRQHRLEIRAIKWRFALAAVGIAIVTSMIAILLTMVLLQNSG